MKMFSKEGVEMVDIKSITRDDERLVIKGKVMGAMTTTILVNPEDCWQAARLLGIGLILRLPLILLKGWLAARRTARVKR
ncbi:hypothetical protein K3Z95_03805 [Pseudomonas aeruginosa]|uniref:Uncharacterized protein n=1 Tax=Pseudomonas paraeruginosa TaxID=2994495 RepID=A0A2R3INN5_9PSED|nr:MULTISPECIES: hypothetical protein [Pseudomonas]VTS61756.1 Uncharacterised protein [Streptococcus dysgalactiae subsp. equisimilis]AVK03522.1 hypothetical protein CSB93_6007 [Pseudomonas paraeruginosa]AWE94237.1 hypothetical protein CSC28_4806 [Pseudomonas paraeruginosa]ELL4387761.1 hypothetical protein [Pseudomonas aeruginosa]KAA5670779.1 hypothetical protein F3G60_31605 [Pseudomonas aeruginosa]